MGGRLRVEDGNGTSTEYELLGTADFERQQLMSETEKAFSDVGMRRKDLVGDYQVHLVRPSSAPTLEDIYRKKFGHSDERSVFVNAYEAYDATLEYVRQLRTIVQHVGPDLNHWFFFFAEPAQPTSKFQCHPAIEQARDCMSSCTPRELKEKRIILVPEGYVVPAEGWGYDQRSVSVTRTGGYVLGDGVDIAVSGLQEDGAASVYLYKKGYEPDMIYGCRGYFMITEEIGEVRCGIEEHADLGDVLFSCFPNVSTIYSVKGRDRDLLVLTAMEEGAKQTFMSDTFLDELEWGGKKCLWE